LNSPISPEETTGEKYHPYQESDRRDTMKRLILRYFAIIAMGLMTTTTVMAGSDSEKKPVAAMAKILLNLNHYPSTKEKEKLQGISSDDMNSAAIQTIALAIHDMEHNVTAEDKGKLQAIVDGPEASAEEKELASILLRIKHYPGSEDKERLKKLMK